MILDAAAMDLLLRLLEAHELVFTSSSVMETNSVAGAALIKSGLLQEHDFEMAVADDDGPHEVIVDEGRGGLGFYSPSEGWVPVDRECLRRYRPDLKSLFVLLLGEELITTGRHPIGLDGDHIWEVGKLPLLAHAATPVWFARRLTNHDRAVRLVAALERRTSREFCLVLTTTGHEQQVDRVFSNARVVSIADVLSFDYPGTIDMDILRARFEGRSEAMFTEPIWLSADGCHLKIGVDQFSFRGAKMIAASRLLYDAYRKGIPIKLDDLRSRSGSKARDLDSLFGTHWERLKRHVKSSKGFHSFRAP